MHETRACAGCKASSRQPGTLRWYPASKRPEPEPILQLLRLWFRWASFMCYVAQMPAHHLECHDYRLVMLYSGVLTRQSEHSIEESPSSSCSRPLTQAGMYPCPAVVKALPESLSRKSLIAWLKCHPCPAWAIKLPPIGVSRHRARAPATSTTMPLWLAPVRPTPASYCRVHA